MKIYFAGSIRGGRNDQQIYSELIKYIQLSKIEVLCEHVGHKNLGAEGQTLDANFIHDRDLAWVRESQGVIAEVTNPSLGVGYELGKATEWGKPILALFRDTGERRLSAMIDGASEIQTVHYNDIPTAKAAIDTFLKRLKV